MWLIGGNRSLLRYTNPFCAVWFSTVPQTPTADPLKNRSPFWFNFLQAGMELFTNPSHFVPTAFSAGAQGYPGTKQFMLYIPKALGRRLAPLKPGWESASHSSSRLMIPVELLSGLGVTSLDILCSALFPWTPCCFQGKNDLTLWMDWICSSLHWRLVGQTKSCHSPFKGFLGFIWKARVKQNSNQWFCSHGDLDLY